MSAALGWRIAPEEDGSFAAVMLGVNAEEIAAVRGFTSQAAASGFVALYFVLMVRAISTGGSAADLIDTLVALQPERRIDLPRKG